MDDKRREYLESTFATMTEELDALRPSENHSLIPLPIEAGMTIRGPVTVNGEFIPETDVLILQSPTLGPPFQAWEFGLSAFHHPDICWECPLWKAWKPGLIGYSLKTADGRELTRNNDGWGHCLHTGRVRAYSDPSCSDVRPLPAEGR